MSKFCAPSSIREIPNSSDTISSGVNSTDRRQYFIRAISRAEAQTLLENTAPPSVLVEGIPLEGTPKFQVTEVDAPRGVRRGIYNGSASYQHVQRDEQTADELIQENDIRTTFSFGGESLFLMEAIGQEVFAPVDGTSRGVDNFLNVLADGTVEGLDVGSPPDTFSKTKIFPEATVTNAWLKARLEQRNTVNDATFFGLDIGDCWFTSFSGNQRSDFRWEVTFNFGVQVGEVVTEIGGIDLGGATLVEGWQYAWVMTEPAEDTGANNLLIPKALQAHVADIFEKTDFGDLGLT